MRLVIQRKIIIVTFLFIPLTLLLMFSYYPNLNMLNLSFTDWNGVDKAYNYIGFSNYIKIFKTPDLIGSFLHNIIYFCVGLFQMALALYFAVLLNKKLPFTNFFRSSIFMPYIMNSLAVAYMFQQMFDFEHGLLNMVLKATGILQFFGSEGVHWLGNRNLVNFSLAFVSLWQWVGYCMVIFLGGLQSISSEIYEAASIDGANSRQTFRYITLPGISTVVELILFLNLNGALQMFIYPFVITPEGQPNGATFTFLEKTYYSAFMFQDYGLACAMGIVLMVVVLSLTLLQKKLITRKR